MDPRDKVCTSNTETYSGGQGAPVSVTKVEPFMSKKGTIVQPSFRIYIKNTGGGSVLSYDPKDGLTQAERCHADNIDRLDWNKIRIKGTLSGKELECVPETLLLKTTGEEAYGVCRVKEDNLNDPEFVHSSNYNADLHIELEYIYVSTVVHEIEILRET
jgi:hypothetical protein